jgi:predicted nucleotide-binding protein
MTMRRQYRSIQHILKTSQVEWPPQNFTSWDAKLLAKHNRHLEKCAGKLAHLTFRTVYVERTPAGRYLGVPRVGTDTVVIEGIPVVIWAYFDAADSDVLVHVDLQQEIQVVGTIREATFIERAGRRWFNIDLFEANLERIDGKEAMSKMFYTEDEAVSALGVSRQRLEELAKTGSLREFRDGPRVMYKADQVEALRQAKAPAPIPAPVVVRQSDKIFIGHGRSRLWMELQNFLERRLKLQTDEFNSETIAGISTTERLVQMLENATFAFLVLTGEDEVPSGVLRARENVVHELGLFQGKLGFKKAIVLLEQGCTPFSNIHGLTYIGFPPGQIDAAFEKVRQVLEREAIL